MTGSPAWAVDDRDRTDPRLDSAEREAYDAALDARQSAALYCRKCTDVSALAFIGERHCTALRDVTRPHDRSAPAV